MLVILLSAILHSFYAAALVPASWRRQGINFDIGRENLGERGVDDETNDILSNPQNQMRLIEAFRRLSELERGNDAKKTNEVQLEVRSEGQEIDNLSGEIDKNTHQIHQLQMAVCYLMQSLCKENEQSCKPCPWTHLSPPTEPPITTISTNSSPSSLPPTLTPSPDPSGSCGQPEAPNNGYVEGNSTTFNTLIVLHCNAGFDLMGDDRMICTAIWNEANADYQYFWAPPMSAICKANGKPTPTETNGSVKVKPTMKPTVAANKLPKREFRNFARRGYPSKCFKPKAVGICKAAIPRFYYDPETKDCHQFIFGGCHGNDNNFESMKDCLCQCKTCP